jgi:hypothetical protein
MGMAALKKDVMWPIAPTNFWLRAVGFRPFSAPPDLGSECGIGSGGKDNAGGCCVTLVRDPLPAAS